MKQWRKSSRWRAARKLAISRKNWRLAAKLECLAYGANPFGGNLSEQINRMAMTESFRLGDSIVNHMKKPSPWLLLVK